mmetsp:Transcript_14510/g.26021  ORF Transcript_14510/g.26021 Transcript_14510/m.26021 type:complete len:474 (-) Transcript_14510:202-1623(-)
MIVYDNRDLRIFFRVAGSAVLNVSVMLPGFLSALIALLMHVWATEFLEDAIASATVYFNGVAFLISFVVVFRSQLAYGRFFQALTSYHRMKSRLLDLSIQTKSFCVSNEPDAVKLKAHVFRWVKLFHKLALCELRGGYVHGMHLENLLTPEECKALSATRSKNLVVTSWIARALAENIQQLSVPAPVASRLFQLASEADLELNGAILIAVSPFPFPYAQIASILLVVWAVITPIFMVRFLHEVVFVSMFLSFLATWIIFGVNESATQLENPFDGDDNDVPLLYFDTVFDDAIASSQFGAHACFFNGPVHCALPDEIVHYESTMKNFENRPLKEFTSFSRAAQEEKVQVNLEAADSGAESSPGLESPSEELKPIELGAEPKDKTITQDHVHLAINASKSENEKAFVNTEVARLIFQYVPPKEERNWFKPLPHVCCHNRVTIALSKWNKVLQNYLRADVEDSASLRAQGTFCKYV